jgi:hypothetical protein
VAVQLAGRNALVAWLCSDDARWITGQTIDSEGGFRRWGAFTP